MPSQDESLFPELIAQDAIVDDEDGDMDENAGSGEYEDGPQDEVE